MGALPRPEVTPGPHRELVDALHDLHHRAGWPSLRRLAEQTGVSHTTVSKALSSPVLPRWGTVELLVEAMGGDVAKAHEMWLAASTPSSGPDADPGAVRIAGRVAELRVVREHLAAGVGLLLVAGEAGIGKTALVDAAVASSDVFVAVGRCLHLSREMPLMPVADALRAVLEHDGGRWMAEALAACPAYVVATVARLLPELDDGAGAPAADALWGPERLLASVISTLRALADVRPLAVHLEDCHWADLSTLDLLTRVASRPSRPPIVATWRAEDPDVSEAHTDWLTRTRWTSGVAAVDLLPLTPAETVEQLRLLTGTESRELAQRIHRRSGGLPLYTAQLAASPDVTLPRALADLLDRRIGDLDEVSWRVARVLGVAQRAMPPALLRGAAGLEQDAMDEALHLLAERRLLRPGTGDDVELAHPLFVEAVARRLVPGEAAEVHARLAETMEGAPTVEPAEVADHWMAAGRPDDEVSARVDAAIVAGTRFAYEKELATWLRVLDLWDAGHRPDDVDLWEVLVRAIDAAVEVGDVETGHDLADRADRLQLDQLSDSARAQVLHRLGSQRHEEGDAAGAEELMGQALRLLDPLPPSPELFRLLEDRIGIFLQAGRLSDAAAALDRSAELLDVADARFRRRHRAGVLWRTVLAGGDAEAAAEEAFAVLANDDPDPVAELMIASNATDALLCALAPAARAEELARGPLATAAAWNLELSYPGVLVRTNVCWAHLLEGNTSAAREWIEPVTRSAASTNTAFAHLLLAAVELREGEVAAALRRSRAADEHIRVHDQNWTMCLPWTAEIELWADRSSDTCTRLTDVLRRDLAGEQAVAAAPMLVALARAHAEVAEREAVPPGPRHAVSISLRGLVADASIDPFDDATGDVADAARALAWEAELSRLEERDTVAVWARAASEWDRAGRPHESAYSRWRGAEVALRDGHGAVAIRLATRARTDARQHVPLARAATATLERHGRA